MNPARDWLNANFDMAYDPPTYEPLVMVPMDKVPIDMADLSLRRERGCEVVPLVILHRMIVAEEGCRLTALQKKALDLLPCHSITWCNSVARNTARSLGSRGLFWHDVRRSLMRPTSELAVPSHLQGVLDRKINEIKHPDQVVISPFKNVGFHAHRLDPGDVNLRERIFAEEWETRCERGHVLEHLMQEHPTNQWLGEDPDRDRAVAATAIQWLGTNVGMGFLQDALGRCGFSLMLNDRTRS